MRSFFQKTCALFLSCLFLALYTFAKNADPEVTTLTCLKQLFPNQTVEVYRVQSKHLTARIQVNPETGNAHFTQPPGSHDTTLYVGIGDFKRTLTLFDLRLKQFERNSSDVTIVRLLVPKSVQEDLATRAILQSDKVPKGKLPLKVDVTKGNHQYGLPPSEAERLERQVIPGSAFEGVENVTSGQHTYIRSIDYLYSDEEYHYFFDDQSNRLYRVLKSAFKGSQSPTDVSLLINTNLNLVVGVRPLSEP